MERQLWCALQLACAVSNANDLCPTGWHVPSDAELTTLTTYAGGQTVAGGRLKSTRTAPAAHPRWDIPNAEATDQYGFSALPGGDRNRNGYFNYIGCYGFWWSATRYAPVQDAWYRYMCCNDGKVYRYYIIHQESGFSVRCLRDN